ncbi:MAG: ribose 5-phosphate isomerase B [Clostridia bacterium]|nr:ribose 5-phosphate isomerase B [Clostridia bacterium]
MLQGHEKKEELIMIAIANDHAGLPLKAEIIALLNEMGLEYKNFGTDTPDSCHYPVFAARAAHAVASGECEFGILLCGTGLGIGMAANKVHGIRCATCSEPISAALSRRHNNANMLSMGARVIGPEVAKEVARAFLTTAFEGGRHQIRVDMISALENGEEIE